MVMRKEENSIILEPGDLLYRYDLGEKLDAEWLTDYSSPEYISPKYGRKNTIGAFFYFNDRTVAIQTLAQAIYNQRELGNIYDCGTITQCEVLNEIFLLDLSTGLYRCSNIISVLCDLGIDVINEQFFNYQKELPHSVLKDETINLFSNNKQIAQDAANEIDKFFLNRINLLGQSLTDFGNGKPFRDMLISMHYEGYVFWENPVSDTYCLFNPNKVSSPIHEVLTIESDEKLQELIEGIERRAKQGK